MCSTGTGIPWVLPRKIKENQCRMILCHQCLSTCFVHTICHQHLPEDKCSLASFTLCFLPYPGSEEQDHKVTERFAWTCSSPYQNTHLNGFYTYTQNTQSEICQGVCTCIYGLLNKCVLFSANHYKLLTV